MRRLNRRTVLRLGACGVGVGLAGCNHDRPVEGTSTVTRTDTEGGATATETDPGPVAAPVTGTVFDASGDPFGGATVEALLPGETVAETTTDADGRFELVVDRPAWIRARVEGTGPRLRAGGPGDEVRLRLPASDAATLVCCGDVMFARRFYEENDDPLSPRARIDEEELEASHRSILAPMAPFLRAADVATVNLESPLSTTSWRHPTKQFPFVSHPVSAEAIAWAGVDYAALANNHVLDGLEPGLVDTIDALDGAGVAHSGAGTSRTDAWAPAVLEANGTSIAIVSVTSIVGVSYDLDWSADRRPEETHEIEQGGETLVLDGDVGAAGASVERLSRAIEDARRRADVVLVQLHSGAQYQRAPNERIRELVTAAAAGGADVIACHHPHVTGGITDVEGSIVAWSLGNFVFDQHLWETVRSYVLQIDVRDGGVDAVGIEPILLDGYRPKGVVGQPRRAIVRETAGLSADYVRSRNGELIVDRETERQRVTESFESGIYERRRGSVADDPPGKQVVPGRNRFITGGFGNVLVDGGRFGGPLWRYGRDGDSAGAGIGEDAAGVRLVRAQDDVDRALLSSRFRLPLIATELALDVNYRYDGTGGLEGIVSWYDDTRGSSFEQDRFELAGTGGEFRRIRRRLEAPEGANYVDLFFLLAPPSDGRREARFDDVRLLEWGLGSADGRAADHLRVRGDATVPFDVPSDLAAEWPRLSE